MVKHLFRIVFICFAPLLSGCEALFFDDLSEIEQLTISNESFKHIVVSNSFNIVLKQQEDFSVTVEAPVELQDGVKVRIVNDTLTISDTNKYQWSPSYKIPCVTFSFPTLPSIHIKAPVNMQTVGVVKQPAFRLLTTAHTGTINLNVDVTSLSVGTGHTYDSGVFTVTGKAGNAFFWMRNSASLNASNLDSDNVRVINNSRGDSYVRTNGKLQVIINSHGNVYYSGTPNEIVIEELTSTGSLIRLTY
ncbi:MAG: head GIN domain-containing protein [Bacteroidales bacterium]|nr:head GIN domain-containing protein [Tenuifilaceae bacterium]